MSTGNIRVTAVRDARAVDRNAPTTAVAVTVQHDGPGRPNIEAMHAAAKEHVDGTDSNAPYPADLVDGAIIVIVFDPLRWGPGEPLPGWWPLTGAIARRMAAVAAATGS